MESKEHVHLVDIAFEYIKSLVPNENKILIEKDSPDATRPVQVEGRFIPDVKYFSEDLYIIGEAKTLNDFDKEHSKKQYNAYISECLKFQGKSILVVSVPWQIVITAKNYFKRLECVNERFRIVILNEAGGAFEICTK